MVLCMLDLGHVPASQSVLEGLAGLGLTMVEATPTSTGPRLGPTGCVMGQFRATDASALEHQLRVDIQARLRRMQVEAGLQILVQPMEPESATIIPLQARRQR
jgi:hypothetical protein